MTPRTSGTNPTGFYAAPARDEAGQAGGRRGGREAVWQERTHGLKRGTGLAPGKNVLEVERGLLKRVPGEYLRHAHHWLILHGRYTCTARKPRCGACLVHDLCGWREKDRFSEGEAAA